MDPEAFTPALDPLALLAWFDPEHLEAKLCAAIDDMPESKLALSPQDKSERLQQIKTQLADAEHLECAMIAEALDKGTLIDHRFNVSIDALLSVTVSRKSRKAA
jgi:hypothetical protein